MAPGEGVGRTGFGLWAPGEGNVPRAVALSALQPAACGLKGKTETPTNFTSKKTAVARLDPDRARLGSEPRFSGLQSLCLVCFFNAQVDHLRSRK